MEEQTIKLETALLAEEKGFNEHTDEVFAETEGVEWVDHHTGNIRRSPYKPPRVKTERYLDSDDREVCKAPTQSLLQKWLREKYDLDVTVMCFYRFQDCVNEVLGKSTTKVKEYAFDIFDHEWVDEKYYPRYEDALEEGLTEALNLIGQTK